jgi:hypothetical protein
MSHTIFGIIYILFASYLYKYCVYLYTYFVCPFSYLCLVSSCGMWKFRHWRFQSHDCSVWYSLGGYVRFWNTIYTTYINIRVHINCMSNQRICLFIISLYYISRYFYLHISSVWNAILDEPRKGNRSSIMFDFSMLYNSSIRCYT